jgi:deoxyribodipyrimidine photo-lyase
MTSSRRSRANFALDRAIELALQHHSALVVLEPLRVDYPFASDRFHRFILEGMKDNEERFRDSPIQYYPYLEPEPGRSKGLLSSLSADALCVVTDDYPCFFLPRMLKAGASRVVWRLEAVDSNGILPVHEPSTIFTTAHSFRRYLQKNLRQHLLNFPKPDPLEGLHWSSRAEFSESIQSQWPRFDVRRDMDSVIQQLPIDHQVLACSRGGEAAASELLDRFVGRKLSDYAESRNHPDEDATSGLSPYLHFGHIGAHAIVQKIFDWEAFSIEGLATSTKGSRTGYWGLSESAEAFLDQVITWRELGFNMCANEKNYSSYESLPSWARQTLDEHRLDRREFEYSLGQFEAANTHDGLWNAAQNQLVREGRIQNYLRMLWGKKILEWSSSPEHALSVMVHLNDKYALDGRDPNSYSGILWCLGRYDRAWGPERGVFGKIRYMSSSSATRKLKLRDYLCTYGNPDEIRRIELDYE